MFPDRLCSFLDSYLSLPQRQPIEVDIWWFVWSVLVELVCPLPQYTQL